MIKEFGLEGKRVLVTGGGRGIGHGIALTLAEAGADVGVTSLNGDNAAKVAEEIRGLGRKGFGWSADATKVKSMVELREKVFAEMGGIDVLVQCVGGAFPGLICALPGTDAPVLDEDGWHAAINANLTQAYVGCHVFGPHLLEKGSAASVINISARTAFRPRPARVAYAAAKAGLTRFTESLALEWAPFGVRVNAVSPGIMPDPYRLTSEELAAYPEVRQAGEEAERLKRKGLRTSDSEATPLGRLGHPREAGFAVVYLASDAAAYVTGHTFSVDGGRTLL